MPHTNKTIKIPRIPLSHPTRFQNQNNQNPGKIPVKRKHWQFSSAVADQNVLQPVVWQQAHGHAQLAAGVIEIELAAGEGVLGLARANRPRRHVAARRGVTNMMLLQHPFIWWLSQWDGAAALPS